LLKAFGPDLWQERRRLLLTYVYTLLAVGALLLVPWPLQIIIDYVLAARPVPLTLLHRLAPDLQVLLLALTAIMITLVRVSFIALEKSTNAQVRERLTVALRDRLLMHAQNFPLRMQLQQRSGELVLRLVDDVNVFVRLLTKTLPLSLNHCVTTISTLVVMFLLEPRLALIGVVVLLLITALARRYASPLHAASREKRQHEGQVSGLAQEIIRSLPTTQALGLEQHTRARFRDFNTHSLQAGVREVQIAVAMERMMAITRSVALAMISAGGAMLVLRDAFTLGELTVFLTYMSQLLRPAEKANEQISSIIQGCTRGEKLLHVLDHYPLVADRADAIDIGRSRGRLELRAVAFAYPRQDGDITTADNVLFNHVNLRIEPGSLCVLVGASGSGKSTLLGLLLRMYEPDSGEILLDDIPLQRLTRRSLRRQFAVMVQHTHLFAGTVREALTTDTERPDDRLWQALEQVALADTVRAMPGGLDAELGEDGQNLSGGQRARLSLARALLLDRPILLLDEPTANVDPASREVIINLLQRLRHDRTCIVITHQQEVIERADRVLHLIKGRIVAEAPGTHRHEYVG
jgi:ATP-binding cassette subfamily B protein